MRINASATQQSQTKILVVASSLLIIPISISGVSADYHQVDISPHVNWNITQAPTGGWPFNTFPGNNEISIGNANTGVPFRVLGANGNNVWLGLSTAPISFDVNIKSPTVGYTLFNTHWGKAIPEVSIEFRGTNNKSISFMLVGGSNIRDWYNGNYTNGIPTNALNWWIGPTPSLGTPPNPSRLDMQVYQFGDIFQGETLTQILITAQPGVGTGGFAPFLSGITISSPPEEPQGADGDVPLPAWALVLFGVGLLGGMLHRKN